MDRRRASGAVAAHGEAARRPARQTLAPRAGTVVLLALALLVWLQAGSAHAQSASQPRRVAFVVGNAGYQNESRLANPHNDVALLARTLREDLRFTEVIERRDLTRRQMVDLVREVRLEGSGADALFVYFSGHGMQGPGGNYLIPVDARIEYEDHVVSEGINARDLVEALRSANPRVAVLVLDACRDSPYSRRTKSATKGLSRMNVSDGNLLVAYATIEGTTADDGTPGNSPYAQALARHLKQTDQPVMAQFDAVRRTTMQLTGNRQSPTREGDLEVGVYLTSPFGAVTPADRDAIEDAAWALCQNGSTTLPCRDYLSGWPRGRYAALAGTRIRDLEAAAQPASGLRTTERSPEEPAATGRTLRDCPDCPELVLIPPGSFVMGSPASEPGRQADEGPQRQVTIRRAFAIGKFEVTQGQWRAVMGNNPSRFKDCGDECPVENVSWDDVQEYIRRLSVKTGQKYRLPSEAEWEYVARAGTTTSLHSGQRMTTRQANFDGNFTYDGRPAGDYGRRLSRAGSFDPNAWGLHDMHGNVWEWVQDCYGPYGEAPSDGAAKEEADCGRRVLRGGGWFYDPRWMDSAFRNIATPDNRIVYTGFRLARTVF